MDKLPKIIYSNKLFCLLMIIIQFGFLVYISFSMTEYVKYIYQVMGVISAILIIYEINRDEEPGFKLTWVLLVAAMPVFGVLFYIFLHRNRISRKIAARSDQLRYEFGSCLAPDKEAEAALQRNAPLDTGIVKYLTKYCGFPLCQASAVKYYPLGDDMFEDLKAALRKAKSFIFIEMFIINPGGRMWPEILEILKERAALGVEVRLMYDGMGCMTLLPGGYEEQMEACGIQCRVFSPIVPFFSTYQNNRDHRKIIIADGEVCFTGGVNLADEYINERVRFGHWKDNAVRITGRAVSGFTDMFLQMWNMIYDGAAEKPEKYMVSTAAEADGFVVPVADSPMRDDRFGETLYINTLNIASSYVHVMTPYLAIGSNMLSAFKNAAKRGVDVKIILPHIPDKPYAFWLSGTYYRELMHSGVEIYEYRPGFVHAKMSVSDDCRAIIGTINHDYRSMYLNYECAAYLVGVPQIRDMESDFEATLEKCVRITEEEFLSRSIFKRIAGRLLRLIAPLM